jgi:protoporphyrinogen oxidase
VKPEEGDQVFTLLQQLNLLGEMKTSQGGDEYGMGGVLRHGLWDAAKSYSPSDGARIKKIRAHIEAVYADTSPARYPDIPTEDGELRSYINKLDQLTFREHLTRIAGGAIPEPLNTAIEQYCWSSFGGSSQEISAASGLNFYTAEVGALGVFGGGNSRITEALCEAIVTRCGQRALRSSCIVSRVQHTDTGVEITFHDETGRVTGLKAPCVIMACPKFVAKRIVQNLAPDRLAAMQRIKYRAYITANVVFRRKPSFTFYDLYLLKHRAGTVLPATASLTEIGATDAILANWHTDHPTGSVLSLYRALPYEGGRASLYAPESYEAVRASFEKQIAEELSPLFGLTPSDIIDSRITRWGHALPLAERGFIASGAPELLRSPIQDKIFFAQQDNWALPALETAVYEGSAVAAQVRGALRG